MYLYMFLDSSKNELTREEIVYIVVTDEDSSSPFANNQSSNVNAGRKNFVSYAIVERMLWRELGNVINKFREIILLLESISARGWTN